MTTVERSPAAVAIEADLLALAAANTKRDRALALKREGLVGEVPFGTGARLARQYGVTRERVRQIAVKANIKTERPRSTNECRRCRRFTRAEGRVCGSCLEEARPAPVLSLVCDGCGTAFERDRRKVAANAKQARDRNRPVQVFCTAACAGRSFYGE